MNTQPPEGSLSPIPPKPVILSRAHLKALRPLAKMVCLRTTWPQAGDVAPLMPVLTVHVMTPDLPLHGAN